MSTETSDNAPEVTPFHEGEITVQTRMGVAERMLQFGKNAIRTFMPDQHRQFFSQLPFIVVGSVDQKGQPWASLLVGRPGFLASPDAQCLEIKANPLFGDPLNETLENGAALGLLGIELHTRRRNRLNGIVTQRNEAGFSLSVRQSFGNCPKYIQQRDYTLTEDFNRIGASKPVTHNDYLDERAQAIIRSADTFFIASVFQEKKGASPSRHGADVSHRGGKPGFVRINDDKTLTIPDFVGNFLFNTLGNLLLEPRAGLIFIDFSNGDLLYLAGNVEIIWEGEEVKSYVGAERLLRFHLTQMRLVEGSLPLRWTAPQPSPFLSNTGDWIDTAHRP